MIFCCCRVWHCLSSTTLKGKIGAQKQRQGMSRFCTAWRMPLHLTRVDLQKGRFQRTSAVCPVQICAWPAIMTTTVLLARKRTTFGQQTLQKTLETRHYDVFTQPACMLAKVGMCVIMRVTRTCSLHESGSEWAIFFFKNKWLQRRFTMATGVSNKVPLVHQWNLRLLLSRGSRVLLHSALACNTHHPAKWPWPKTTKPLKHRSGHSQKTKEATRATDVLVVLIVASSQGKNISAWGLQVQRPKLWNACSESDEGMMDPFAHGTNCPFAPLEFNKLQVEIDQRARLPLKPRLASTAMVTTVFLGTCSDAHDEGQKNCTLKTSREQNHGPPKCARKCLKSPFQSQFPLAVNCEHGVRNHFLRTKMFLFEALWWVWKVSFLPHMIRCCMCRSDLTFALKDAGKWRQCKINCSPDKSVPGNYPILPFSLQSGWINWNSRATADTKYWALMKCSPPPCGQTMVIFFPGLYWNACVRATEDHKGAFNTVDVSVSGRGSRSGLFRTRAWLPRGKLRQHNSGSQPTLRETSYCPIVQLQRKIQFNSFIWCKLYNWCPNENMCTVSFASLFLQNDFSSIPASWHTTPINKPIPQHDCTAGRCFSGKHICFTVFQTRSQCPSISRQSAGLSCELLQKLIYCWAHCSASRMIIILLRA